MDVRIDDVDRKILAQLQRDASQSLDDIAREVGSSKTPVWNRIRKLREAGVIRQRVEGTHRYYSVNADALRTVNGWTMDHRAFWASSLDRLDTMLALDPEGEEE